MPDNEPHQAHVIVGPDGQPATPDDQPQPDDDQPERTYETAFRPNHDNVTAGDTPPETEPQPEPEETPAPEPEPEPESPKE